MMTRLFTCYVSGVTRADQMRGLALAVGATVALMLLLIGVESLAGRSSFTEALRYAAFPLALMASKECTSFKRYSTAAKWMLIAGGSLTLFLATSAAVVVARALDAARNCSCSPRRGHLPDARVSGHGGPVACRNGSAVCARPPGVLSRR